MEWESPAPVTPPIFNGPTRNMTVKLKKTSYTYNGKAHKPGVTVYVGSKKISSSKYSVTYKNNKNVGTATVKVKGKGSYKGLSATATFKIKLNKTSISSAKSSAKKKITVKWQKDSQAGGYQVQYALNSSFTSSKKTKAVGGSKTSVTLTGLKSKKTYYVRIRSYKKVSGSKWYSSWSSVKKVKTK